MDQLKYKYSYIWLIVAKWRSFHNSLSNDFPHLKNGLSHEYRQRLITSAVKGASYMYILSKSVDKPFNQNIALSTGMLSALFDDLIDEHAEDFNTMSQLIRDPQTTKVLSLHGEIARQLYIALLNKLEEWQKDQLNDTLEKLLTVEKVVKTTRNGEWKMSGAYAFFVYLTLIGIPLEKVNYEIARKYGEYLQLLDDYEDYNIDDPVDNFFKTHPGFDLTSYYLDDIKPKLHIIFNFRFDHSFFCDFVETYHVFQTRTFNNHQSEDRFMDPVKRKLIKFVIKKLNGNVSFHN
jgi:hypothetical protein